MYTSGSGVPDAFLWICAFGSEKIAQKANGWREENNLRYVNTEYRALCDKMKAETNPAKRSEMVMQLNDFLVAKDFIVSPLVARKNVGGAAKDLKGINLSPWDSDMYNIADWAK
jgi:peptide/nickel transport system substrate-binding protein